MQHHNSHNKSKKMHLLHFCINLPIIKNEYINLILLYILTFLSIFHYFGMTVSY